MARRFSCAFTAAWMILVILLVLLVALWVTSTLFGLHVWEEFWEWIRTFGAPPEIPD